MTNPHDCELMEAVMESHDDKENYLVMADMDAVINKCVNDIWHDFDANGDGILDKEETKAFVRETLSEMDRGKEFSEADWMDCFKAFDKDGSGEIEKPEMAAFIRHVLMQDM